MDLLLSAETFMSFVFQRSDPLSFVQIRCKDTTKNRDYQILGRKKIKKLRIKNYFFFFTVARAAISFALGPVNPLSVRPLRLAKVVQSFAPPSETGIPNCR